MVAAAKQHITEVNVTLPNNCWQKAISSLSIPVKKANMRPAILIMRFCYHAVFWNLKSALCPELADKSKAVLIYCRTGGRSALAAQTMQQLGYNNVLSMAGGFEAWQKA